MQNIKQNISFNLEWPSKKMRTPNNNNNNLQYYYFTKINTLHFSEGPFILENFYCPKKFLLSQIEFPQICKFEN